MDCQNHVAACCGVFAQKSWEERGGWAERQPRGGRSEMVWISGGCLNSNGI